MHTHAHKNRRFDGRMLTPLLMLAMACGANAQVIHLNASDADIIIDAPDFFSGGFPTAICSLGNINGDAFDDILVSSSTVDNNAGKVWVYFGPTGATDIDFIFSGPSNSSFGAAIAGGGDADGDGVQDFIVGAPLWDAQGMGAADNRGRTYVYSGADASLLTGWNGANSDDEFGTRVAFFVDVDENAGDEILTFSRRISDTSSQSQLRTISSQVDLFTFDGGAFSNPGLVNTQDSIPDIAIGLPFDDTNGNNAGIIHFRQGDTGALITPIAGPSSVTSERLGEPVQFMDDLNSDGFGDVLASSRQFQFQRGRVRVISGEPPLHSDLRIFTGEAEGDMFGASIANVGDINNDNVPDILVGAPRNDPTVFGSTLTNAGRAYLYSGATGALLMTISGATVSAELGRVVSGAGDFNGDGVNDLVVAAPGSTDPITGNGRIYIFFMPRACPSDINGDGTVNGTDLANLLAAWGTCGPPASGPCLSDLNGDGVVDGTDLAALLANWGNCEGEESLGGGMNGEDYFMSVLEPLGIDDMEEYLQWLDTLNTEDLADHLAYLISAILGNE